MTSGPSGGSATLRVPPRCASALACTATYTEVGPAANPSGRFPTLTVTARGGSERGSIHDSVPSSSLLTQTVPEGVTAMPTGLAPTETELTLPDVESIRDTVSSSPFATQTAP